MDERLSREEILSRLSASYRRFEATLDRITPAQALTPNVVGVWSPKDVLAHMLYWQRLPVRELEAASRGEVVEGEYDSDRVNARSIAENRGKNWDDLRGEFRQAHTEVVDTVTALPESAFESDSAMERILGDTVAGALGNNTWEHYDLHEAQLREWLDRQGK